MPSVIRITDRNTDAEKEELQAVIYFDKKGGLHPDSWVGLANHPDKEPKIQQVERSHSAALDGWCPDKECDHYDRHSGCDALKCTRALQESANSASAPLLCNFNSCITNKETCHECIRNSNYSDLYKEA